MSEFMGNLSTYFSAGNTNLNPAKSSGTSNSYDLDMSDFLNLMVTQLTSQTMDSTADTSDMLNQMVMMQMVTALTNMTDSSIMSYAASLVGKTVTVGQYDADGKLQEIVGTVTGTGMMDGSQVVFVDDKYYFMSEIMAVGVLPEPRTEGAEGENGEKDDSTQVEGTEPPKEPSEPGDTDIESNPENNPESNPENNTEG